MTTLNRHMKGIAILAASVAAALVLGLTAAITMALVFGDTQRDQLEQTWSEDLTSDQRADICIGYVLMPGLVATEIENKGYDEDVVADFLADECGSDGEDS